MTVHMLLQLAALGVLLMFSVNIYLWLKGFDISRDEAEITLLTMNLPLEDIENLQYLSRFATLGRLLLFGVGFMFLMRL